MSNDSRKIENATLIFCAFQIGCLIVGGLSYGLLAYRVKHFDYGKLRIDEGKILEAISRSTRNFLADELTNSTQKAEVHVPETDVVSVNGVVWETLRTHGARIDGIDYIPGDYYKYGTNIYEIFVLNTDRQRAYCVASNGDKLVLCLKSQVTKERESADSTTQAASDRFSGRERQAPGDQRSAL